MILSISTRDRPIITNTGIDMLLYYPNTKEATLMDIRRMISWIDKDEHFM